MNRDDIKKRDISGFTLIELIVVMVIVAVLVLLAAPRSLGYTKDAEATAIEQDTKILSDVSELYKVKNGEWPAVLNNKEHYLGYGGIGYLLPVDEEKMSSYIKNIKGNYDDYGIAVEGKYAGKVFSLSGVGNKEGDMHFGNNLTDRQPVVYKGKKYQSIVEVPEDPVNLYLYDEIESGYEVTGFNQDYINSQLNGESPTSLSLPSMYKGKKVTQVADGLYLTGPFSNKNIEELIIPGTYEHLGNGAFPNNNIKHLILPESIKTTGKYTFYSSGMKTLELNNGLKEIGHGSFEMNGIREVHFPNTLTKIGNVAFLHNDIERVVLPPNLTFLGNAFINNKVREVVLNNQLIKIETNAFMQNYLTRVTIPESVQEISGNSFAQNGPGRQSNSIPIDGDYHGTWVIKGNNWVKEIIE